MAVDENYIHGAMRPTLRTWIKHTVLLLVTLVTATIAGTLYPFGPVDPMPLTDPGTWRELLDLLVTLPTRYAVLIGTTGEELVTKPQALKDGLSFSVSLLFILISHEMGH